MYFLNRRESRGNKQRLTNGVFKKRSRFRAEVSGLMDAFFKLIPLGSINSQHLCQEFIVKFHYRPCVI